MTNILLQSLDKYYNNGKNMEQFNDYVNGDKKISLRIIDWFVTNYSKKYNVFYEVFKTPTGELTFEEDGNELVNQINIFHAYKSQLKSYSKKKFDPFCRKERIMFNCKDYNIETTLGQLNFFKWALDNMILEYITENYNHIENDMNVCFNKNKKNKTDDKRKPRQELSKSASRGLNTTKHRIILDFN